MDSSLICIDRFCYSFGASQTDYLGSPKTGIQSSSESIMNPKIKEVHHINKQPKWHARVAEITHVKCQPFYGFQHDK